MRHDTKNVTDMEARRTCVVVAVVLTIAAAVFWYRGRETALVVSLGLACVLVIVGWLLPPAAKRFHRIWYGIAFALGWVNSRILLTIIYFVLFIPYGVISRLARRDPLDRRGEPRESYWHDKQKTRPSREQFERLF